MDVIAEGLEFPEGPVVMEDGSVILVEIHGQRVTRCWDGGRKEVICVTGGGPNGAAYGPDGAIWLCNNGGLGATGPGSEGRIERVDLSSGKCERVFDACDGIPLSAPNDLVFDSSGRLWFTDLGTLFTWTTAARPLHPGFKDSAPYAPVVVEMDEGVRLLSEMSDCTPEELEIGMPVEIEFTAVTDEVTLPRFRRA